MVMLSPSHHRAFVIGLIGIAIASGTFGCRWATAVRAPNQPGPGTAEMKGLSKETLDYFEEKYPPGYWKPGDNAADRLAVGPILINREAAANVDATEGHADVTSGQAGTGILVGKTAGAVFVYSEKFSLEAQAILAEEMGQGPFTVFATDRSANDKLVRGTKTYRGLSRQGVSYFLTGNMAIEEGDAKKVRLYLRVVDTATQEIIAALSRTGNDVPTVTREAARALLSRLDPKKREAPNKETGS